MRNNSYKGRFKPNNPSKYLGDVNNIIYRSLLERRFMIFCDNNSNIISWASEEVIIPYISPVDNQPHRYFPDFWIKKKDMKGNITECIIEIKPFVQTQPPKQTRKTKRLLEEAKTYSVNQAKWEAAKQYTKKHEMDFIILTEKDLTIGKK